MDEEAPQLQHSPELQTDAHTDPEGTRYWEYIGPNERVYTNVPVTIKTHEMIKYPSAPAEDGCWREVQFEDGKGWVLKAPDNAMISDNEPTPGE